MRRPQPQKLRSFPVLEPSQSDWAIERIVPGGAGFMRLGNGQGAFAAGALPGERIRVQQAEDHRTYLRATRWTLLETSPDRVEPVCPVQATCGGCDLMALSYSAQLIAKVGILREALLRTGRFRELPEIRTVASERTLGYRSRIRLHVASDGRVGFFATGTQELVEIPSCPVADPALDRALTALRAIAARYRGALSRFAELELRVAPSDPRCSLWLLPRADELKGTSELLSALSEVFQVSLAERASDPERDQRFALPGGVELRAPAQAFTQINWPINRALVQALLDAVERRSLRTFCDLYCGAGNFSLPLLSRGLSGVGIEAAKASIAAAKRAAAAQQLQNGRFLAGDVREVLSQLPSSERFDLILLDPPRSGARDALPEISRRAATHIAYCACDPVTLARDLRILCDAGYTLEELTVFDMFPQTHHFETLVWLSRARASG
ncbi:MAG TPA: methyltransferase domain-containing protein [Polyangiaceae bacterium]|nr:methyltransferase domain-containing protein [Polyangiaceae bacterium]